MHPDPFKAASGAGSPEKKPSPEQSTQKDVFRQRLEDVLIDEGRFRGVLLPPARARDAPRRYFRKFPSLDGCSVSWESPPFRSSLGFPAGNEPELWRTLTLLAARRS